MDAGLQELYEWVDSFAFSRKKRSFARDFADAFLCVEMLESLWPGVISTRSFSAANALSGRLYNWNAVRTRAFARLGIPASQADVEAVAAVQPGAAEWVLALVRQRAEEGGTGPLPPPASPGPPPAWVAGVTPSPMGPAASSPAYSTGSAGRAGGPAAAWVRARLAAAAGSPAPPPPALPADHLVRRRAAATPPAPSAWTAPPSSSPPSSSAGGRSAAAAAGAAAAAAEVARLRASLRRLERVALLQEARIESLTARLARAGSGRCADCSSAAAAAAPTATATAGWGGGGDAEGVLPAGGGGDGRWSGGGADENSPSPPRSTTRHHQAKRHSFSGCGGGMTPPPARGRAHATTQRPSCAGVAPPPPPPCVAGTPGPLGSSWAARPAAEAVRHTTHGRRWW